MIADNFMVNSTIVFDNAIFSDHFAELGFLKYKKISKQHSTIKTFFDKKKIIRQNSLDKLCIHQIGINYIKLQILINDLFTKTIFQALEKHPPIKKFYQK